MKTIKYIFSFIVIALFMSCEDDNNDLSFLDSIVAPSDVLANFQIAQDNSGLVTITPNATGAASYNIKLGVDELEPVSVKQGESVENTYDEGVYTIELEAVGLSGLKTVATQDLVVSFRAPENLEVTAEIDGSNPFILNVSAVADFAASFNVFFDTSNVDEEPTMLALGETVSFEYPGVGDYTIRVVALSGGLETTEITQVVTIEKPTELPIDFEIFDASVFNGFGGASNAIIDNPDTNGNESAKVAQIIKDAPEGWAGNVIELSAPLDFSTKKLITMDVWSPRPDGKLLLKLENQTDDTVFIEKEITLNGTSSWEEAAFDLSDISTDVEYQKIVLFFDFGTVGDGSSDWTFYVDNIKQSTVPVEAGEPLLFDDFDGNSNITTWTGDAAGLDTALPNPYVNADNFSATVLEYTDTGGTFANIQFVADSNFDLSAGNSVFTLKVYVPSSSVTGSETNQISLKLQNSSLGGNAWQTQTEIVKTIVLDQWQEVSFDFVNDNWQNLNFNGVDPDPVDRTDLDKVVLQLNGENNSSEVTGYIDDFYYGTAPAAEFPPFARDGFEGRGTITTWLGDDCGMDNAFANPFIDANNNSATVLQYDDTGGTFANVQFTITPNLDISLKSKFTLKVYVPSSSVTGSQNNQISLKLQNSSLGGNAWQTQTEIVKTIVLDQWQELTFDFINDNWQNLNFNGVDPDPVDRTDLDKVVLQLNGENNNDLVTAYIDDFNYHN
ncbi:hypothetical protein [Algibacter aquimarinus]